MAEEEGKDPCDTPFLRYLQSGPDTPYTCWFLVGDPDDQLPELISGCKLHLMAHSVPMRNMLYESEIAEEGTKENPVKILDIKPDTFRHFVKYVNSNNFPTLLLEEAVDLLYVADKYIIEELKTELEEYILSLLNVDSVFVLLKRPNCLQNETLINAIHEIVQQNTEELFAEEEFLDLSSAELLHIVTQDTLAVTELELWREILRWAKHQAQSEEGGKLREVMSELMKHTRFCTLHMNDFSKEVVSTGILTPGEVFSITSVVGGKLDTQSEEGGKLRVVMSELLKHIRFCTLHMYDFCKEVVSTEILTMREVFSINMIFGEKLDCKKSSSICYEQRNRFLPNFPLIIPDLPKNLFVKERKEVIQFVNFGFNHAYTNQYYSNMFITTDADSFQLLTGEVKSPAHYFKYAPKMLKLECKCTVSLTRITDYGNNTSTEQPVKFDFVKDVLYDTKFVMPFPNTMKLLPYNKYKLEFKFTKGFPTLNKYDDTALEHQGLLISWSGNTSETHLRRLKYKTL